MLGIELNVQNTHLIQGISLGLTGGQDVFDMGLFQDCHMRHLNEPFKACSGP